MTDENFWAKVERSPERDGHWLWLSTTSNGSPAYWSAERQSMVSAARVAFLATGHQIPEGHRLRRTCEVRLCVNPDHRTPMTPRACRRVNTGARDYLVEAIKLREPEVAKTTEREIDGRTYTVTTYDDDFTQARESYAAQERELFYWKTKREYMHFRDPNMTLHKMVREGRLGRTHRFDKTEDLDNQHQP